VWRGVGDSATLENSCRRKNYSANQKVVLKDNNVKNIMPKINKILVVHLSFDESLFGGDKIVWSSSFLTCYHEGGRGYRSAVLRGEHYCDMTGGQSKYAKQLGQYPEQIGVVDPPSFLAGKRRRVIGVVRDVAGVVEAVASVVGAVADTDEEVIGADWICTSSMVIAVKLLKPVDQVT